MASSLRGATAASIVPDCSAAIGHSAAGSPTDRLDSATLREQLRVAFGGKIEPVRRTGAYRVAVFVVALVMILLPLAYVGIIALTGWGVYWHLVNDVGMLGHERGQTEFMVLMAYVAPLIVGSILVIFMVKPLLSRSPRVENPMSLDPGQEPMLIEFIDRICDAVRAPRPVRIDVDANVNASASFEDGVFGLLTNRLVLTIGMPLVVGLDTRALAGVVAHEFGHFAQGGGMRLSYIIRSINFWFLRVVYQRDEWDARLERWSKGIDLRIGWILFLARAMVWLTRKILWALMMVGQAVSCHLMRQMEFDADRHAARLAGSEAVNAMAERIRILATGQQWANNDLAGFHGEGRLVDDLPVLVARRAAQLEPEQREQIARAAAEQKTGWFDTHPSDAERAESVAREGAPGVFQLELPAGALFSDCAATSRAVSEAFFRSVLPNQFDAAMLRPVDELLEREVQARQEFDSLNRFFQGAYTSARPLVLAPLRKDSLGSFADRADIARHLDHARQIARANARRCRRHVDAFNGYQTTLGQIDMARRSLSHKLAIGSAHFSRPLTNPAEIDAAENEAKASGAKLEGVLRRFERVLRDRLSLCLVMHARRARVERQVDARARLRATRALRDLYRRLTELRPSLDSIQSGYAMLSLLFATVNQKSPQADVVVAIGAEAQSLADLLNRLFETMEGIPYPFDHRQKDITLAGYFRAAVPEPGKDLRSSVAASELLLAQLPGFTARVLGQLCRIAEEVERSMGLEPLPLPDPDTPPVDPNAPEAVAATTDADDWPLDQLDGPVAAEGDGNGDEPGGAPPGVAPPQTT